MAKFQLPSDGSVVVIEDQPREALPLIKLLCKKGIACTYYNGKDIELPEKPLQKVRLAFVDIELSGPTNPQSNAANVLQILDKIISEDNGPYILIIWSTRNDDAEVLKAHLLSASMKKRPVIILKLEKASFFDTSPDESQKEEIFEAIDANLNTRFSEANLAVIKDTVGAAILSKPHKKAKKKRTKSSVYCTSKRIRKSKCVSFIHNMGEFS